MKKTISFEKKIEFTTMIGEITTISLEHDLKFINENNIEGMFIVNGTYKMTEASRIEEPFTYELPVEILLTEKLDINNSKIEISDFYYEIENEYNLICYIDVQIEGVEVIELSNDHQEQAELNDIITTPHNLEEINFKIENIECENNRNCDGEYMEESDHKGEEETSMQTTQNKIVHSLFEDINEEETFTTYSVYILREEETISSLINKYKTTKEELESYNDLSNLSVGSKIIIPLHNE